MKGVSKDLQNGNEESLFREAEELFLRVQEPNSGLRELEEFDAWGRRSPVHRKVADELQQLWIDFGRIQDLPWPSESELAHDRGYEDSGLSPMPRHKGWQGRFAVFGSSIAASVLVALGVFLGWPLTETLFETGVGEHQLIQLADGSEITLGGKSRVRVIYSDEQRLIRLEAGEGLFTVAKDPERPFYVDTANISVRAVGTAFNVRSGLERIVVSVVEGTVRVSGPTSQPSGSFSSIAGVAGTPDAVLDRDVTAGEQITIGKDDSLVNIQAADVRNAIAWRDGRFVFSGEPLASVVAEINRYSESRIEIADSELGELYFSGTVLRGQMDDWLEGLERAFPMHVERVDQTRIVIHADGGGNN